MKRNRVVLILTFLLMLTSCKDSSSSINSSLSSESSISEVSESSSLSSSEGGAQTTSTTTSTTNTSTSTTGTTSSTSTTTSSTSTTTSTTSNGSSNTTSNETSTSQSGNNNAYYSAIDHSKTGTSLRTDLASLVTTTHKKQTTYDGLKDVFKVSDADPNKSGNVLWFYTGTSKAFSGFGSAVGQTNREHVWPKDGGDAFPEKSQAGSDAHHLRPMEVKLNSLRGNKSFGVVPQTTANIAPENNSTTYASGDYLSYMTSSLFYPGKGYRGQTARILFYVQLRWGNTYNLKFVTGSGNSKTIGDINALIQWNLDEPPTEHEMKRNEEVYKIQGNRNPFIDDPSYACSIYAYDGSSYNNGLKSICGVN